MKDLLKLFVCWVAFGVAVLLTGMVCGALHLRSISMSRSIPGSAPAAQQLAAQLCAGVLLVLGLYPLARRLAGSFVIRSVALGGFLFLALGVNGTIEARMFTHLLDNEMAATAIYYAMLALLLGSALAWCFGAAEPPAGLPRRGWMAWSGRVSAAWLAWPVIYFFFGMCVSPVVIPYYRSGSLGLHIPPLGAIFAVQLVRSAIFLASSLPFLALWRGSRRGSWLALGLAHAFVVGIYGLTGATFLPWVLRVAHGVEMTADSFAYAGLLVLLFRAPEPRAKATRAIPRAVPTNQRSAAS
jgi:hypothetical protein